MADERILINVDLDRYESLVKDEERTNALLRRIRKELQKVVDRTENKGFEGYRSVSAAYINIEEICTIIGADALYKGYADREKEAAEKYEREVNKDAD